MMKQNEKELYFQALNRIEPLDPRLRVLEQYSQDHHIPIMEEEGIGFVRFIISMVKPKKILEIGTAIGYSAISFALTDDDLWVTTIERDPDMAVEAKRNIEVFGLTDRIRLLEDDAITLDVEMLDTDYDLLFIDAAKSQYQHFFKKYTPLLKPSGLVITDNIIFHNLIFNEQIKNRHTRQLMRKLRHFNAWLKDHPDFITYFFPIGDGISLSIKR